MGGNKGDTRDESLGIVKEGPMRKIVHTTGEEE